MGNNQLLLHVVGVFMDCADEDFNFIYLAKAILNICNRVPRFAYGNVPPPCLKDLVVILTVVEEKTQW